MTISTSLEYSAKYVARFYNKWFETSVQPDKISATGVKYLSFEKYQEAIESQNPVEKYNIFSRAAQRNRVTMDYEAFKVMSYNLYLKHYRIDSDYSLGVKNLLRNAQY